MVNLDRVPTLKDALDEDDETFILDLLRTGVDPAIQFANDEPTCTMLDDDEPAITFTYDPDTGLRQFPEDKGTVSVVLRAQTAGNLPPTQNFDVRLRTVHKTTRDGDYVPLDETLTFRASTSAQ